METVSAITATFLVTGTTRGRGEEEATAAARRYQSLRHYEDVPQLPSGYFGMFLLAYAPPLWFRVMDPKVLALVGGDESRVNRG